MSLSAANHATMQAAFNQVVNTLGVPASWDQAKPPHATATATVGFKTAGKDDTELVNAYGIGAKVATFIEGSIPTPPEKFDSLTILGEKYTLDAVMPIHLNGVVIGRKAMIRGK